MNLQILAINDFHGNIATTSGAFGGVGRADFLAANMRAAEAEAIGFSAASNEVRSMHVIGLADEGGSPIARWSLRARGSKTMVWIVSAP